MAGARPRGATREGKDVTLLFFTHPSRHRPRPRPRPPRGAGPAADGPRGGREGRDPGPRAPRGAGGEPRAESGASIPSPTRPASSRPCRPPATRGSTPTRSSAPPRARRRCARRVPPAPRSTLSSRARRGRPSAPCARPDTTPSRCRRWASACSTTSRSAPCRRARVHHLSRLAIFDFDVHHGNGTQDIFWDDPDTLYVSTHQSPLYPGTGARHRARHQGQRPELPPAARHRRRGVAAGRRAPGAAAHGRLGVPSWSSSRPASTPTPPTPWPT